MSASVDERRRSRTRAPTPAIADRPESRAAATARLLATRTTAPPGRRDAIDDELVRLNMPMAAGIARRYRGRGIADEDLESVAYLGLVRAVRGFDAARGHEFLDYAGPTIRGEIRRHFRDHGWTIRPPRSVQEAQSRISSCEEELYQELGRAPRPSEIIEHTGLDPDLVVDALGASGCFTPTSLDRDVVDAETLGDHLGQLEHGYDVAEVRALLGPLVQKLTARERLIIDRRFVRGLTQAEIGEEIGVTQMQVSRLLSRLISRLRAEIEDGAAAPGPAQDG
jgi:RNA polymerase sigma-B factor